MRDLLNRYKKLLTEDSWELAHKPLPLGSDNPCISGKHDYTTHSCCGKCDYELTTDHSCYDFCTQWGECCKKKPLEESTELYDDNGLPYKGREKEFPPARTRSNYTQAVNEEELSGETEMEEFAEKRGSGAEKISDSAKEKGGLSLLTYNHFRVKLPYYEKAAEGKLNMNTAKKEYNKLLEKLYSSTKGEMELSQTAFQELMGKIEVLGELLLESNE